MHKKVNEPEKYFDVSKYLAVLIVIGLLIWGGFSIYSHHHATHSDKSAIQSAKDSPLQSVNAAAPEVPYLNVVESDNLVIQESPSQVVRSDDQLNILETLHKTCTGTNTYLSLGSTTFDDDSQNFRQAGDYAAINVGVCNPLVKSLDDLPDGGAESYLHKDKAGNWVIDTPNEASPDCSKVDGLGYPASVMPTCKDGSEDRQPK